MRRLFLPVLALLAFWACQAEAPQRSARWPAVRHAHLVKEPACQWCRCTCKLHMQVHHIQEFSRHPELELVDANLITLCECPAGCPQCKCIPPEHNCHLYRGHLGNFQNENPTIREQCIRHQKEIVK
jgi:hypothetical protein